MNKNVIYAALMFVVTMSSGNASAQQFPSSESSPLGS